MSPGLGPICAGVLLLVLLWKNLAGMRKILGWRLSPVRAAAAGPASIQGVIKAASAPLASRAGRPCVLVRSRYRALVRKTTSGGGKTTVSHSSHWMGPEETEVVKAVLDDGTAQPMPIDLHGAGVVETSEVSVKSWPRDVFIELHPVQSAAAPLDAHTIELHETIVPDGARVLLRGTVSPVEPRDGEADREAGYRQPPPTTLGMGSSEEAPLVVVPGGRGAVVMSAVRPAFMVIALSLALFTLGALMMYQGALWGRLERSEPPPRIHCSEPL